MQIMFKGKKDLFGMNSGRSCDSHSLQAGMRHHELVVIVQEDPVGFEVFSPPCQLGLSGSESSHEVHARSEIEEVDCVLLPYPSKASQSDLKFRWSHFSLFPIESLARSFGQKKSDKMNRTGGKEYRTVMPSSSD
jgi:hypothetical protein